MTIAEDLERLKVADHETWKAFFDLAWASCPGKDEPGLTEEGVFNGSFAHRPLLMSDRLQGCIQRAIKERGWHWLLEDGDPSIGDGLFEADIYDETFSEIYSHVRADTPAEAILTAYLAAMEAMG